MEIFVALLVLSGILFLALKLRKNKIRVTPANWDALLVENVQFYQRLTPHEKIIFQEEMVAFLADVYIDAVGFELEEIDRVLVAASAIIPVFHFRNWRYTNITGVIIYPDNFNERLGFAADEENKMIAGMVGTGKYENQMILSRKALHHGFTNKTDKHNTAVHEFVHLLDKADGEIDGLPELFLGQENILPWLNLMHKTMEAINNDQSDIRNYGGTSQVEFFAVASEYFFERPKLLKRKHPELFAMLEKCFTPQKKV